MMENIEIHVTVHSISTRFTVRTRTFTFLNVVTASILGDGLAGFQAKLISRPVTDQFCATLKAVAEIINTPSDYRTTFDLAPGLISESLLLKSFLAFNQAVSQKKLSLDYSKLISKIFRDIIIASNCSLVDGRPVEAVLANNSSVFYEAEVRPPNITVSDLAAVPHKTIKELHESSIEYLKNENDSYLKAAEMALDEHARITEHLERLRHYPLTEQQLLAFDTQSKKQDPWRANPFSEEELMALTIRKISIDGAKINFPLPGMNALPSLANFKHLRAAKSFGPYWLSNFFLPSAVLVSIATVIAIKTGWNTNSVSHIKISDIKQINTSRFLLQGDKRKTDDRTPIVEVHKSDDLFFKSLTLLSWHFNSVTSLGLYQGDMVFVSKVKNPTVLLHSHVNPFAPSYFKKYMVNRFDLKKVVPTNFRDNVASLRWLETNDIEIIRELLGHNSINTTHEYLRSGIISSLNQSKILEFQRRIEATIIFYDKGDAGLLELNLDKRHIDLNLIPLTQLGDGTRCLDPHNSPLKFERRNKCSGQFCHEGNGCPNNRITIEKSDVELLIRTLTYYRARWHILHSQNPDLFKKVHLTKLIFMRVLLSVIQSQRPDLVPVQI